MDQYKSQLKSDIDIQINKIKSGIYDMIDHSVKFNMKIRPGIQANVILKQYLSFYNKII